MRAKSRGVGGHQRPYRGHSDHWLTPPEILAALGPFDLDPCGYPGWVTAAEHYLPPQDGLVLPWQGRVYLNPPYGPETGRWLERLASHGNGIALVFARTETAMFHRWAWRAASGMLFLAGRLHFHDAEGRRAKMNSGAPSVLVAFGQANVESLRRSGLAGALVGRAEMVGGGGA